MLLELRLYRPLSLKEERASGREWWDGRTTAVPLPLPGTTSRSPTQPSRCTCSVPEREETIPNAWRRPWATKQKSIIYLFLFFSPPSKSRRHLPVSGDGLLRVLYWLWTYGVLWWELKADEEARSSSSLMMQALGWSSGRSSSLCSRAHLSRSRRWDDSLRPDWACETRITQVTCATWRVKIQFYLNKSVFIFRSTAAVWHQERDRNAHFLRASMMVRFSAYELSSATLASCSKGLAMKFVLSHCRLMLLIWQSMAI